MIWTLISLKKIINNIFNRTEFSSKWIFFLYIYACICYFFIKYNLLNDENIAWMKNPALDKNDKNLKNENNQILVVWTFEGNIGSFNLGRMSNWT